jgi:cyclopropane-fatty-acyl-phospholipid synthase
MKPDGTLLDRLPRFERSEAAPGPLARWSRQAAKRLLLGHLRQLEHGQLTLVDGSEVHSFGRPSERCDFHATIHVVRPAFYAELAFGGSVGAGESFMAGDWRVDDLTAAVRILLANRHVVDGLDGGGSAFVANVLRRALHAAARNTREGSRRNIAAHYDLGNDFFALMLDPTMMYSCAFFEAPEQSLQAAQEAKLDRICRKLGLQPSDHLLEIGTGWGGLALHAAGRFGCRVTTTTISREQHALACERVREAGLDDRVTVLLEDYRDLSGRYDKVVSIEMIEAVGHQYFDAFFQRCASLLAPGGTLLLQSITIDDRQYEAARDSVDFIKRHIFPGCCIPSVAVLHASASQAAPLRLVDLEDIGPHYATTLAAWRRNLHRHAPLLQAIGYGEVLQRMFTFYLCYCEGGFAERSLGAVQMLFQQTSSPAALPRRV